MRKPPKRHGLDGNGAPALLNDVGNKIGVRYTDRDGPGVAFCYCGSRSKVLPDAAARHVWFAAHLDQMPTKRQGQPCPWPEKHRHDKAGAVAHAKSMRRTGARDIQAYSCPAGGHWHVGNKPGSRQKRRPRRTGGKRRR